MVERNMCRNNCGRIIITNDKSGWYGDNNQCKSCQNAQKTTKKAKHL